MYGLILLATIIAGVSADCSTVSLPASTSNALSNAAYYAPDIYTIGTDLSTIELSSPSLSYVESVIASYIYSSPSIVTFFEGYYAYPSVVTDEASLSYEESQYPTLATAIASLYTIEASHWTLSYIQPTLQSVMSLYESITQDLTAYTAFEYSSIYTASEIIGEATLTSPSIIEDYLSVYTIVSEYPSISADISSLSYYFFTLPSTVDSIIISYISSPSTVAPSAIEYLSSCYPSIYSYATAVVSFTYTFPTIVSALTDYLSVASTVSSIGSAIYTIISYEEPTFTFQESIIQSAIYTWPSLPTDLSYISDLEVTSPTLAYALSYLEQTFYSSPSIAESLYYAIVSPSTVTDPEAINDESMSHQSFTSAISIVLSFESAYPSYAETLSYILPYLTAVWQTEGTLLTAYSYLSSFISPSVETAEYSLASLYSVVSDWSTVLSAVTYATVNSPSLTCAETLIASYAYEYSSVVELLWSVLTDASAYTLEASEYADLEASYSSIVSALEVIFSAASAFPSLYSYEGSFIEAAASDSYLLYEYSTYTEEFYSVASSLWWYSSSSSSSY